MAKSYEKKRGSYLSSKEMKFDLDKMIDEMKVDRMDWANASIVKPMNKSINANTSMVVSDAIFNYSEAKKNLQKKED